MSATVLYYSSNSEHPEFEQQIQKTVRQNCGNLPIISVTQQPTTFGENICVGEVGASGFNMIRQILIGCEVAKTRYIISAEADCLYPPDYFTFRPEKDDACYRNTNTYLLGYGRDYFWKKPEGGTWAQVINREFYISRLRFLLFGQPEWDADKKNFPKEIGQRFFASFENFTTKHPCVSIKAHGMRKYSHAERIPIPELPYWGSGKLIRETYHV